MYIVCHHAVITNYRPIKLQFPLFLATVLTNELVILTILFLQFSKRLTHDLTLYIYNYNYYSYYNTYRHTT